MLEFILQTCWCLETTLLELLSNFEITDLDLNSVTAVFAAVISSGTRAASAAASVSLATVHYKSKL